MNRATLSADLVAGLTFALVNIPQSMAHALLAAVNPVSGLYTRMLATPVGALFTSAVFMNISTTSALAVAAGDTLLTYPSAEWGTVVHPNLASQSRKVNPGWRCPSLAKPASAHRDAQPDRRGECLPGHRDHR